MNPPADDLELTPEKLEEEKEGGALFHCDLYDTDLVYKTAQELLPGLASACVDNTTGGLFRNPASVAVDIRREMVDYLIQRSENYVAESVLLEGNANPEISDDPYDIISDFIDDFASSKRNFFSKVSGWVLSERREDRIDDFGQEMEINGFWLLNRRESVAQTLLKNVDFKNIYHCSMKFKSPEEVEEHKLSCGFRTMICNNEGCNARFTAAQSDQHDSVCPFKILQCEQKCEDFIMRREMDRHCITVCPMKLVKCPFYSVGCHSSVPQCKTEEHRTEDLSSHLLYILHVAHKEASTEDLKLRVEELIQISSPGQLAKARDARALTYAIKPLEAKLGPIKINTTAKSVDEVNDLTDKDKVNDEDSTVREVKLEESPTAKRESVNSSPSKSNESPTNLSVKPESPSNNEKTAESEKSEENEDVNKAEVEKTVSSEKSEEKEDANKAEIEKTVSSEKSEEKEDVNKAETEKSVSSETAEEKEDVNKDEIEKTVSSEKSEEKEEGVNKAEIEIGKEKVAEPIKHEHSTQAEEHHTSSVAAKRDNNHADSDADSEAMKSSN